MSFDTWLDEMEVAIRLRGLDPEKMPCAIDLVDAYFAGMASTRAAAILCNCFYNDLVELEPGLWLLRA